MSGARSGSQLEREGLRRRGSCRSGSIGLIGLTMLCALACVSCYPPATTAGFDAPLPAARIFAARRAGELTSRQEMTDAIPHLIECLDADDVAIRFTAIAALQKLTGETYGYRYYDPEWMRRDAVNRWVSAWQSGTIPLVIDDHHQDQSQLVPAGQTSAGGTAAGVRY